MNIRHDGTATSRCETCVETQLAEQGTMRYPSDATLARYDRARMTPDNAEYLGKLRDKARRR